MPNPGSLTMGFAGVDLRQLAPSVGTAQVGNVISAVSSSPTLTGSATATGSDLCESLGFKAHLPALKPVFTDLHSGVNLTFGAYQIYINHWGTLRLIDITRAPTIVIAATTGEDATRAANPPGKRSHPPNASLCTALDRSSGIQARRSTIPHISKEVAGTPSQVLMAEVDEPPTGGNG